MNYCDAVCQKLEWFTHKKQCKRLAEEHKEREEFIQKENVRHKLEEEKKKLEEEKTRLEEEEKRLEEEQKEAQKETITNGKFVLLLLVVAGFIKLSKSSSNYESRERVM